jgi:hypothetical protein
MSFVFELRITPSPEGHEVGPTAEYTVMVTGPFAGTPREWVCRLEVPTGQPVVAALRYNPPSALGDRIVIEGEDVTCVGCVPTTRGWVVFGVNSGGKVLSSDATHLEVRDNLA